MRVRFTSRAIADIEAIAAFIRTRNHAAAAIVIRIEDAADILEEFPLLGRHNAELDVRVLNVKKSPYSMFYNVEGQEIWVLHIRDGRRRPPRPGEI